MSFYFYVVGQVANKLFHLSYVMESIEQFATNMLQSVLCHASDAEHLQYGSTEQRAEGEVGFFSIFFCILFVIFP